MAEASKGNSAKSPHSASDPRRQHPDSFEVGREEGEKMKMRLEGGRWEMKRW